MKKLIIILTLLLAGCFGDVPVKPNWPDIPQELKTVCPDLNLIKKGAKLSEVIEIVADNYYMYHECQVKVDAWKEWYDTQKQIYEEVK